MLWASFNLKSVSRAQISLVVSCYFGAFMEHMQICGLWSSTWQVNKIHKTRCDSRIAVCKALVTSAPCQPQSSQEYSQGNGLEGLSGAQQTGWLLSQSSWGYRGAGTWSNPAAAQSPLCLKTRQIIALLITGEQGRLRWHSNRSICLGGTDKFRYYWYTRMPNLQGNEKLQEARPGRTSAKAKIPEEKTQMWRRQHYKKRENWTAKVRALRVVCYPDFYYFFFNLNSAFLDFRMDWNFQSLVTLWSFKFTENRRNHLNHREMKHASFQRGNSSFVSNLK